MLILGLSLYFGLSNGLSERLIQKVKSPNERTAVSCIHTLSAGSQTDVEDAVMPTPTFRAGKCAAGRGAAARAEPHQAQDSTVSQMLPTHHYLLL